MDDRLLTGIFAILGVLASSGVNLSIEIYKENAQTNKDRRKELYIPVLTQIKLLRHHVETINSINGELEMISESNDLDRPGRYEELVNLRVSKENEANEIIKNLTYICKDRLPFSRQKDFDNFISLHDFLSSASTINTIYNPDLVPPLSAAQLQTLIRYEKYFHSRVATRFSFG
jgi:hypothetical protein